MTLSTEIRATVRVIFNYRCGYCGLAESDVGNELEVDHFQPVMHGGTDALDNLVYACTACNRFKSSYWPDTNATTDLWLLHPLRDDSSSHITEMPNGQFVGLTPRGWFHIRWLHLNRPQLVQLRQLRREGHSLTGMLKQAEVANTQLRQRIAELEEEIVRLNSLIRRLTGIEETEG